MPHITTAEVVRRHGVSRRTVLRMAESGELPPAAKFPTRTGGFLFDEETARQVFSDRAKQPA